MYLYIHTIIMGRLAIKKKPKNRTQVTIIGVFFSFGIRDIFSFYDGRGHLWWFVNQLPPM